MRATSLQLASGWLMASFFFSMGGLAQDSDQNQLTNFCRRFAHQTAWIDGKLYVDGGYIDYGSQIDGSTVNNTNTQLLWADTTTVTGYLFPPTHDNLAKPANVPSVAGGTLWADEVNKLFYLYGGEYNWTSPPPQQFTLWSFDTIYNTWNATSTNAPTTPNSFGSSAVDQNKGTAYYYGGWKSNATEVGFAGSPSLQSGLVTFDLSTREWGQSLFIDDTPRGEGALFYIPASDQGMLVYFGGVVQTSNGSSMGINGTTGMAMDTIWVYDIGGQRSYSQQTSGPTPSMRRRFCGGVSWPDDRSSFDIYLYGGLPPYDQEGLGFGDAWILSLPSFTWTQLYASDENQHHSLSCNVINQGQMIIMGGYFPNSSDVDCDAAHVWGMHNLNLGANDVAGASWYTYQPNLTYYSRPPNLTEVIGGTSTGNPTLTTPSGGFNSADLGVYMGRLAPTGQRTATRPIPTATSSSTSKSKSGGSTSAGAIAGGVVGGVVGLLLILGLVFCCLRRRKRRAQSNMAQPDTSHMGETSTIGDPSVYGGSPNHNKRDFSGASWATSLGISSHGGSSEHSPQPLQTNWQPVPMPQQVNSAQQYYPPPPQAQPFYPKPPAPQQYTAEEQSPAVEMPSVRSPMNVEDVRAAGYRGGNSPTARRTGPTIHEE